MPLFRAPFRRPPALLLLALLALLPRVQGGLPATVPEYPGRRLILAEDFNGPDPDQSVWTISDCYVQTPWNIDAASANNAYTENGNLVLLTRREDRTCQGRDFKYTTGWIDSLDKISVREGVVEVRALLPPLVGGKRNWPAFW